MSRVLVIEDDSLTLQSYMDLLYGLDSVSAVVPAKSATEVLAAIEKEKFALILLDIIITYKPEELTTLPVEKETTDYGRRMGFWLYDRIREKDPTVPVIVISVLGPGIVGHKIFGATRIFQKGESLGELLSMAKALLNGENK